MWRTHLGHIPEAMEKVLMNLAEAISGDRGDWNNPSIKAKTKKGGSGDDAKLSSEDTYATQVSRVMMTLEGHKKAKDDDLVAGIAREMAQRTINSFRGEFNRDLNAMMKAGRVTQKDKDRWNELDNIQKDDMTIRQGEKNELSASDKKELDALWKKLNDEYKSWRADSRKSKSSYTVPSYLKEHHKDLLNAYQKITSVMDDNGSLKLGKDGTVDSNCLTGDRGSAGSPYFWKKGAGK